MLIHGVNLSIVRLYDGRLYIISNLLRHPNNLTALTHSFVHSYTVSTCFPHVPLPRITLFPPLFPPVSHYFMLPPSPWSVSHTHTKRNLQFTPPIQQLHFHTASPLLPSLHSLPQFYPSDCTPATQPPPLKMQLPRCYLDSDPWE